MKYTCDIVQFNRAREEFYPHMGSGRFSEIYANAIEKHCDPTWWSDILSFFNLLGG